MNPTQKAGNPKPRRYKNKPRKGDYRTRKIARMEAKKVLAKKVESKNVDIYSTATNVTNNGSFISCAGALTRGTGASQFIGDSVLPTHLRVKWACIGADTYNLIRVIVIQNKAGGVPVAGTLMQLAASVNTPISPYNRDYSGTYRVLFDEFYNTVGYPSAGSPTETSQISGDIRIPAKKLHKIEFDAGATVTSGDIYVIFFSDSTIVSPPVVQFYIRMYYKDA